METIVEHVDVWVASIDDKPGGLAKVLSGLRDAGADLDFIISRRSPDKPGSGLVFVTPLRGDREVRAASTLGFNVRSSIRSLRIQGENRPGTAAGIMEKLAAEGINVQGFSGAVIGTSFIMYIGLDSAEDEAKAIEILKQF